MKFDKQINALSKLSWEFKSEIDKLELILKDKTISDTYRVHLISSIKEQKEAMRVNVEAIDILLKEG